MQARAGYQRRIHIHHAGVESITGIRSHAPVRSQLVEAFEPLAECDEIGVREPATLGHARRAGCVQEDEDAVGGRTLRHGACLGAVRKVAHQKDLSFVLVHYGPELLFCDQQLHSGILDHEVQTLGRIGGIERLIGAAGLQYADGCDGHPLAAGDQHGDDVSDPQPARGDVRGDPVADRVDFGVRVAPLLVHYGGNVRSGCGLGAEQRNDGLVLVVREVGEVEAVQDLDLSGRGDADVADIFLYQQAAQHGIVTLQEGGDKLFRIKVGVVFGLELEAAVPDEGFQIEGDVQRAVPEADDVRRLPAKVVFGEDVAVPGEHGVGGNVEVTDEVDIGIGIVLPASFRHLLGGTQEIEYGGVVIEPGKHGNCPDGHSHGAGVALILAPVIYRRVIRLLFIVEPGEQERIRRGEDGAAEYAVFLAEGVQPRHLHVQRPEQVAFRGSRSLEIGEEGSAGVAAVEGLGIPFLALRKGLAPVVPGLRLGDLGHRNGLGLKLLACIGLVDVLEDDLHRGAVDDDMVEVREEVEMLPVLHQPDVEEPSPIQLEGPHEPVLGLLDVRYGLERALPAFILRIQGLHGVAVAARFDAGEERGVRLDCGLHSRTEALTVEASVKDVHIWKIVEYLSLMGDTLGIDAILAAGKGS